jgi:excisionase family DNA binding protein
MNYEESELMQTDSKAEWITYEEAQRLTSLGRTTLWRICSAEDSGIEVARVGRAVRINRNSLLTYMERCANDVQHP